MLNRKIYKFSYHKTHKISVGAALSKKVASTGLHKKIVLWALTLSSIYNIFERAKAKRFQ